ncbi:MAG: inorganic phosphate transporter [Armatimonadetes bacterium]|nr:inorganic phosphate transporter [Armatimonadota bacterium]
MPDITLLLIVVIAAALAFDYINGFHDTANAIATVVSTRVLSPTAAIIMAASLNFMGALVATHVAKTIAKGIVVLDAATETLVLAAIIGAIVWNLVTWVYGIPSSSSHALVGGLIGAALAKGGTAIVQWGSLMEKVVYPLVGSPVAGFVIAFFLMKAIARFFRHSNPGRIGNVFRRLQLLSAASMAFSHGMNDAQKAMGIITLALIAHNVLPADADVPVWVIFAAASAMAAGTAAGGWRIMRTMGQKIIRLEPVHGFVAETAGAAVITTASVFGMPISTTHAITSSIFGVGTSKRLSAVRWGVAKKVVAAWVITIPAAAAVSAVSYWLLSFVWPDV